MPCQAQRMYMRNIIFRRSRKVGPPAPGLMETMVLAASCLPLIIACSSNPSNCVLGLHQRPAHRPRSWRPPRPARPRLVIRSSEARFELLVGLEQDVQLLVLLDDLLGLVLVVPEVRLAHHGGEAVALRRFAGDIKESLAAGPVGCTGRRCVGGDQGSFGTLLKGDSIRSEVTIAEKVRRRERNRG